MGTMAFSGVSIYDLLGVKPSTYKEGDLVRLRDMHAKAFPEDERRNAALLNASQYETGLIQTDAELEALSQRLKDKLNQMYVPAWDELIDNSTACDSLALSEQLRPLECQIMFVSDARGRLSVRLLAARLVRLERSLDHRKIQAVLAGLRASISDAETISKLVTAGVFQNDNRVALVSEQTEVLRAIAKEADRQVGLAEEALRAEQTRQTAAEQARMLKGTITRAEIASAIPAYQE